MTKSSLVIFYVLIDLPAIADQFSKVSGSIEAIQGAIAPDIAMAGYLDANGLPDLS